MDISYLALLPENYDFHFNNYTYQTTNLLNESPILHQKKTFKLKYH